MDRNTVTVMSGQTVDFFDTDFRELYAVSQHVDLYREFNITKPPVPVPVPVPIPTSKPKVEPVRPLPVSTSRFQVSVNDPRQLDLKVPAHKYHNPKYSLVFGNSRGLTGSLQDLSTMKDSLVGEAAQRNVVQSGVLHPSKEDHASPESLSSPAEDEDEDGKGGLKKNASLRTKKLSSIKHFLKGRATNHITETIEEGVVTPQSPALPRVETSGVAGSELDETSETLEKLSPLRPKTKKPSKTIQRSLSLQTLNMAEEEGELLSLRHLGDPPQTAEPIRRSAGKGTRNLSRTELLFLPQGRKSDGDIRRRTASRRDVPADLLLMSHLSAAVAG